MAKMVTIHETTFEHLNEVKISMDRIVESLREIRDLESNGAAGYPNIYERIGKETVKIVKEYLGDEW